MTDQSSKEERKSIPHYNGYHTDQPITQWIREAEAIATLNEWDDEVRKRYIASRLKGSALNWHIERLPNNVNESYADWKKAIIENFKHPADIDKLKIKFQNLKQNTEQTTKNFIGQIKSLYYAIYGEKIPEVGSQQAAQASAETKALRDDILLKVLMQGLLPKIKEAMWNGRLPPDYNWDQATKAAIEAEKLIIAKELNTQNSNLNAITPQNTNNDIIIEQQKKIEEMEKMLKQLSLAHVGFATGPHANLASITSFYPNNQTPQGNVRFQDNYRRNYSRDRSRQNSRERPRHYSRERSRYYSNERHRSRSKEHQRARRYSNQSQSPYRNNRDARGRSKEQGHSRSGSRDHRNRSRSNSLRRADSPHPNRDTINKQNIDCYRCGNRGHIAAECYTKNPKKQQNKN